MESQETQPTPSISENHEPRVWRGFFVIAALVVLVGMSIFFALSSSPTATAPNVPSNTASTTNEDAVDPFATVRLEGRAAYVYDVRENRELFSKNGTTALPIASITKVMTALVAHEAIPAEKEITISAQALATEGDSGLTLGERWTLGGLIDFVLVTSSNDGATALREAYEAETGGSFIAAMNNKAAAIGLEKTSYVNETGLDEGFGKETNAGSPRDMALLFAHTMRTAPALFEETRHDSQTFTSLSGTVHTVSNTNRLANEIPWSVGAKTGFTDSAGGNLAVAFDASLGYPVVVVVMGASREGRFTDMQKLIEATLEASRN